MPLPQIGLSKQIKTADSNGKAIQQRSAPKALGAHLFMTFSYKQRTKRYLEL